MNKNPIGFSGGGIWAVIALLVLGVGWVESRFGEKMAGYAVIALAGALFLIVGFLLSVAAMQAFGALMIGMEKARSRINLANAKTETVRLKGENEYEKRVMRDASGLARVMAANYKSQIAAEFQMKLAQHQTPEIEAPADPYVIGLSRDQYSFRDDEG